MTHFRLRSKLIFVLLFLFSFLVLTSTVRGLPGNPRAEELLQKKWNEEGPFELSPERGRFALLYSLIEDHSFYFSLPIARFAIPDLGYKNGRYVSLFAPGVSFLAMPGYIVGKYLGASQVGAYVIIAFFALCNGILIYKIARFFGATTFAALIGWIVYLFATPAFSYAAALYQHHISTFLILFSTYLLLRSPRVWSLFLIWFLFAMSIPVDYPNLFLMFPIVLAATNKIVKAEVVKEKISVNISVINAASIAGILLPLLFFFWFNQQSYGNPLQFSGTVPGVTTIDEQGAPASPKEANPQQVAQFVNPETQHKSAISFFQSRRLLNGLYIVLLSSDRGILNFTPVILLGFVGFYYAFQQHRPLSVMALSVIGINVLLYSMWGDPWGGWAFGSRYLIPSYAILAIFLSVALSALRKKTLFLLIFSGLFTYSVLVNTAGALTSNANPPKVEVLALEQISGRQEKYTFGRDLDLLRAGTSKSFVFQTLFQNSITAWQYYQVIAGMIIVIDTSLIFALRLSREEETV